jgi:hypothetical protein
MTTILDYRGYRFPPGIFARSMWLDHRFSLSFPYVEDLLADSAMVALSERAALKSTSRVIAYARSMPDYCERGADAGV